MSALQKMCPVVLIFSARWQQLTKKTDPEVNLREEGLTIRILHECFKFLVFVALPI